MSNVTYSTVRYILNLNGYIKLRNEITQIMYFNQSDRFDIEYMTRWRLTDTEIHSALSISIYDLTNITCK